MTADTLQRLPAVMMRLRMLQPFEAVLLEYHDAGHFVSTFRVPLRWSQQMISGHLR